MHAHRQFTAHLVDRQSLLFFEARAHLLKVFEETYGLLCIEEGIGNFVVITHGDAIIASGSYVPGGSLMTQFEVACTGVSNIFSIAARETVGEWDAIALSQNSIFIGITGLPRQARQLRSLCVDVMNATVYALSAARGDDYLGIIGNDKIIIPCCNRIAVPVQCLGPANIDAIKGKYPGYDWTAYAKVGKHVFLSEIRKHKMSIMQNTKNCLDASNFEIAPAIKNLFK